MKNGSKYTCRLIFMRIAFCRPHRAFIVQSYGNYGSKLFLTFNFFANVMNSGCDAAAKSRAESAGIAGVLSIANRLHFARQQAIA